MTDDYVHVPTQLGGSTLTEQMAKVGLTIVSIDELEELRALKVRVDRLLKGIDHGEFWTARPTDVTTWLRETTDG